MQVIKMISLIGRTKLLILLLLFLSTSVKSQGLTQVIDTNLIPLDPEVRYGELPNGLRYYLKNEDSNTKSIEMHLVVKAGIYHENEKQLEYAHLIEHLGAKGTINFPQLGDDYRKLGRFVFASTSFDNTTYSLKVPQGIKEELTNGLNVLKDWTQNINFNDSAIKVERGAILGEMRTNDPYNSWLLEILDSKILGGTDYKMPSPHLYKKSIENIDKESVLQFYRDWYQPHLEAVIIVGDIAIDSLELEIRRSFSSLQNSDTIENSDEIGRSHLVNINEDNHYEIIRDSINPDLRVYIATKRLNKGYNPSSTYDYKSKLLQELYWMILSSRSQYLIEQFRPAFSEFTTKYNANSLAGGQINVSLMTVEFEKSDKDYVKRKLFEAFKAYKVMHSFITETEFSKAKTKLLKQYLNTISSDGSLLAERYRDHFVKGKAAPNPKLEINIVTNLLRETSLEEFQYFIKSNSSINQNTDFLFFTGTPSEVPEFDSIKKLLDEVSELEINTLSTKVFEMKSFEKIAPIPIMTGKPKFRRTENLIGVTSIVLENGIKIVLKPSEPAEDIFENMISIHAYRSNNIPFNNREEYLSAKLAPGLLEYCGAGSYTGFELDRFKQSKEIRLNFKTNSEYFEIISSCKESQLQELLNLIYLYAKQPVKDMDAFNFWKRKELKSLGSVSPRGSSEFVEDKIQEIFYPEIPVLNEDDLSILSKEQIFEAIDLNFTNFRDYTFVVTGDFNKDQTIDILTRNLNVFPIQTESKNRLKRETNFPLKKSNEIHYIENIDQAYASLYFPVIVNKDLKTQHELNLLSRALHSAIWDRLREGCYSPRAWGEWIDREKGIYAFRISFDSDPNNTDHMINIALEEFTKLGKHKFTSEWLDRVIQDEFVNFGNKIETFGYFNFWSEYLRRKLGNEDIQQEILQYETLLNHFIDTDDLNIAAEKYLNDEYLQIFKFLPDKSIRR